MIHIARHRCSLPSIPCKRYILIHYYKLFLWSARGIYKGVSFALVTCIHNLFLFIHWLFGLCWAKLENNGCHQMIDTLFFRSLNCVLEKWQNNVLEIFFNCPWVFWKNWVATLSKGIVNYTFKPVKNISTKNASKIKSYLRKPTEEVWSLFCHSSIIRDYSVPLLGATIASNLVPWVLKRKSFVRNGQNDICFGGASKQNALFS